MQEGHHVVIELVELSGALATADFEPIHVRALPPAFYEYFTIEGDAS
jgi:hypothetical protein